MYVVCVSIHVKPEFAVPFIDATFDNARHTRLEPGNLRFDVLRREDDPNRFFLYEVYKEQADFVRHQQEEHYFRWRDTVNEWMADTRVAFRHLPLFYGNDTVGE